MDGLRLPPYPWVWVRRWIAHERWHCPPWVVDLAPEAEVALELELSNLEARYQ